MAYIQPYLDAQLPALLSIMISASFLVLFPFRLSQIRRSSIKVVDSLHGKIKATFCILFLLFRMTEFGFLAWKSPSLERVVLGVGCVSAFVLCVFTPVEHKLSVRPSALASLFLVSTVVCDGLTLLLQASEGSTNNGVVIRTAAQLTLEVSLLVAECWGKEAILLPPYEGLSPEETAGGFSKIFFSWINPVLVEGYSNILLISGLPVIDSALSSEALRKSALRSWDQREKPETQMSLPKVMLHCLFWPFLSAVLPRLFLVAFRYSQPLLIKYAIRFAVSANVSQQSLKGLYIILVAIAVYLGLAISTSVYQHSINRLRVMTRGVLVSLIHKKALISQYDRLSEGRVVTLMSNDVDSLDGTAGMFHETWAHILEVFIGTFLLAKEVGWLWPLPLLLIFFCSRMSQYVAKNLRSRQGSWNAATQNRISMTSSILKVMKNVKMLGLQRHLTAYVERLRKHEIVMASKVRWMMVAYNASANAFVNKPQVAWSDFAQI